jgi:branched-chain amino acid transport system substrate-binding protein
MNKFILSAMAAAMVSTSAPAAVKVGLMLPLSGTFSGPGHSVENGFKLYVQEHGGKLGGQPVEIFSVDDEANAPKATENANRLIQRDQVDVVVGSVHSGVALALAKVARDADTTLIVVAGADALTGPMCSDNIFRTSFTNWQPGYAMGPVALEKGYKTAVTITWKYAAGEESTNGFKESFEKGGGKVVRHLTLPFPSVEFQSLLTEIAAIKPDTVYGFFAGGGAVKFVQDYAAAGLKEKIPLVSAFLTDGTLEAQGESAQGLLSTLHYADGLNTPRDNAFRANYAKAYPNVAPDSHAVHGYDAAQLLDIGLTAVGGDASKKAQLREAMRNATLDSPRGQFKLSKAGNPVQDIYLRVAKGNQNVNLGVSFKQLADPARGCKL